MNRSVLLVCFSLYSAAVLSFDDFEDCGSSAELLDVRVSGCKEPPCRLVSGQMSTISFDFTTNSSFNELQTSVHGVKNGIPLPFNDVEKDGCKSLVSGSCPASAGQTLTYSASVMVKTYYPKWTLDVKWELKDQNKNEVVCFLVECYIQ